MVQKDREVSTRKKHNQPLGKLGAIVNDFG